MTDDTIITAIRCTCYSEAVFVEPDKETGLVFVSIMNFYNSQGVRSFWERLRLCWKILRTGRPYGDQMCFDGERTRALAKLLTEAADQLSSKCRDEDDTKSGTT